MPLRTDELPGYTQKEPYTVSVIAALSVIIPFVMKNDPGQAGMTGWHAAASPHSVIAAPSAIILLQREE